MVWNCLWASVARSLAEVKLGKSGSAGAARGSQGRVQSAHGLVQLNAGFLVLLVKEVPATERELEHDCQDAGHR